MGSREEKWRQPVGAKPGQQLADANQWYAERISVEELSVTSRRSSSEADGASGWMARPQ